MLLLIPLFMLLAFGVWMLHKAYMSTTARWQVMRMSTCGNWTFVMYAPSYPDGVREVDRLRNADGHTFHLYSVVKCDSL